jgi:hypothetical protein
MKAMRPVKMALLTAIVQYPSSNHVKQPSMLLEGGSTYVNAMLAEQVIDSSLKQEIMRIF